MKTVIICTNQTHEDGPTPIFRCQALTGLVAFCHRGFIHNPDFVINFDKETIQGHWGGRVMMTKDEAQALGADFGLWFES